MDLLEHATRLGAAFASGLLIGLQRGWQERQQPEGGRVAGLRTFALIGLLGGVLGLGTDPALPLAVGLAGVALLFAVSFGPAATAMNTISITSAVAALVTFGLGAYAAQGQVALAVGTAAVVALLLGMKRELHGTMRRIGPAELTAFLQLGVLTAAVLPLLPNEGLGPYEAWNPFKLWLAVVVVAAISLVGHLAARWRGPKEGLVWGGLVGGLVSSTAATLSLARSTRAAPTLAAAAASGVVAANGVMFLRMGAVVGLLQPSLLASVGVMLLALGVVSAAAAAWQWRRARQEAAASGAVPRSGRVFDLPTALGFAAVLAVVTVAVRAAQDRLGEAGLYGVSFLSGLVDVDAILISTIQLQAQGRLAVQVALTGIALAVLANMLVKAVISWTVGGAGLGRRVAAGYGIVLAAAVLAVVAARMA